MNAVKTHKSPWWEAMKAAAGPFVGGLAKGAVFGLAIGVVTASIFAGVEGIWPDIFAKGNFFGAMNGFTSFKIQTFFNAVITAGVMGVTESYNIAMDALTATRSYNQTLDKQTGREVDLPLEPQVAQTQAVQAPELQKNNAIQIIIKRGKAPSHEAQRIAEQQAQAAQPPTLH